MLTVRIVVDLGQATNAPTAIPVVARGDSFTVPAVAVTFWKRMVRFFMADGSGGSDCTYVGMLG